MDVSIGKVSDNRNYQNEKSKPSPCACVFKAWNFYSTRFGRERERKTNKTKHSTTKQID
jgi:hypothetical protein